jgi:hypothetical protein
MALIRDTPVDLALTVDGDLALDGPDLGLVSGAEGVAQGIRIAVQLSRGEWFLDLDAGVPYFEELLGRPFDAAAAARAFRSSIARVPGVAEILAVDVEFSGATRELVVRWRVRAEFGDTIDDSLAVEV